ncbi:MAG: S9 family peptidase [Acidobacteria bacterium]|nr:S9 family peptidase [Acidobacteriota bacterium]
MQVLLALLVTFLFLVMPVMAQQQFSATAIITDPSQVFSKAKEDVQTYSAEHFMVTRIIDESSWSPDGNTIAFISNISGRKNIWLVAASGGWPKQLTISDQQQGHLTWSGDGKWIAFMSDYGGDEQWDIFLVSPLNGEVINLTNSPDASEELPSWSPDSTKLAYKIREKDAASYEICVMDISSRKVQKITSKTSKELFNDNPVWSANGKHIAYTEFNADLTTSNIFTAEVATGKTINLTLGMESKLYFAKTWSPDGNKLLIASDAANGYENIGLFDITSRKIEWLTQDKSIAEAGSFSPNGKIITWASNINGNKEIFFYDVDKKQKHILPIAKGVNTLAGSESAFSKDGSKLLFYHNGPDSPNDIWVYSIKEQKFHQVTYSFVGALKAEDLVQPFLIEYPSTDGKWTISAFVYIPHNLKRNKQNPAIIWIHGGPAAQSVNWFNPIIQFVINQGYSVIIPNYRGSTGYGTDFANANKLDGGGGDLADVIAAGEWMKKTGYVDPKQLIAMGGSYGGYLTSLALAKSPENWAAGISIIPFFSWFTEVENADPSTQEYLLSIMGDPVANKALWEDRSPIYFVDKIKAPMLILAGDKDPRCPKSEAEKMASEIKKRNGIAELKIYENEGHGFSRIENEIDVLKSISNFLKKYVPVNPKTQQ